MTCQRATTRVWLGSRGWHPCLALLWLLGIVSGCDQLLGYDSQGPDPGPVGDSGGSSDGDGGVFDGALTLAGPASISGGVCSEPMVVGRAGAAEGDATAPIVEVLLGGNGRGAFYRDAACSKVIDRIILHAGEPTAAFHFRAPVAESLVLRASDAASHLAPATLALTIEPTQLAVKPLYAAASDWNRYVSDDGVDAFGASGAACETIQDPCLHGGELRRVALAGLDDCAGLDYGDALGVFDWVCRASGDGLTFFSRGLRRGRGLRDLITATAWRSNRFQVRIGDEVVAGSEPSVWWSNPIRALPRNGDSPRLILDDVDDDGDGPDEAIAAGTILVADGIRLTNGYNINGDRLALVTLGDGLLSYAGSAADNCHEINAEANPSASRACLLAAGTQRFLWIEANLDGSKKPLHTLLNLYRLTHSTVANLVASRCTSLGLVMRESSHNRLREVTIEDTPGRSVTLSQIHHNRFEGLTSRRSGEFGASLSGSSNVLRDVLIEGATEYCLYANDATDNLFVNLTAVGGAYATCLAIYGDDNRLFGVRAHRNNGYGLVVGGDRNVVVDVVATNNRYAGLRVACSWCNPDNNTFVGVLVASNEGSGLSVSDASVQDKTARNTFSHVTALNNSGTGISVSGADKNLFVQLVTANNGDTGLALTQSGDDNVVHDLVSVDNAKSNVRLSSSGGRFSGRLIVGGTTPPCYVTSGQQPGLIDKTCTVDGTTGSSDYGSYPSDAVLFTGAQLDDAFIGKVSSDATNGSSASGTQLENAITDWIAFDSSYRFWGLDGGPFPSADNRGRCAAGVCRIWDARLSSTPSPLRSANGDFAAGDLVAGAPCPASASGDASVTDQQDTPNTFLANAIEVLFDEVGDDDGLCESNETCLFSPHLGAFQGDGAITKPCAFADGIVSGVSLRARDGLAF